jgi:hypothetical protein
MEVRGQSDPRISFRAYLFRGAGWRVSAGQHSRLPRSSRPITKAPVAKVRKADDIATRRLFTQHLAGPRFASVAEAVGWMCAIQSQIYSGAKWALGQRVRSITDKDVDRLFDQGTLLRTHVLRPTWHFVLPRDIRWLLELTAPRVKAAIAYHGRSNGIDAGLLRRAYHALERALRDRTYRTRLELSAILGRARIVASGQRLAHILMRAELDALITSGPRRGKQMTYALLDERVPPSPRLAHEEALGQITLRYFTSHGPAQLRDFAWWSGLRLADAKRGIALAEGALVREDVAENTYWSAPQKPGAHHSPTVHLLPNFDEFLVAYRDRSASLNPARGFDTAPFPSSGILAQTVIWNGHIWGEWKRRLEGRRVRVSPLAIEPLDRELRASLERAVQALAQFLETPVELELPRSGR